MLSTSDGTMELADVVGSWVFCVICDSPPAICIVLVAATVCTGVFGIIGFDTL
jgi:hypothetical protein